MDEDKHQLNEQRSKCWYNQEGWKEKDKLEKERALFTGKVETN